MQVWTPKARGTAPGKPTQWTRAFSTGAMGKREQSEATSERPWQHAAKSSGFEPFSPPILAHDILRRIGL